jgi:hypothetical protein
MTEDGAQYEFAGRYRWHTQKDLQHEVKGLVGPLLGAVISVLWV